MALSEIYQEEKNRWRSSFLRTVVIAMNSILILMITLRFFRDFSFHPADFVLLLIVVIYFMMLLLARKGFLALASILLVAFTYAAICYLSYTAKGIYDSSVFAFMAILAISYLLLDWQYSLGVLILCVGWIWFMGVAEMKGLIEYHGVDPIPDYARDISFTLLILAVLSHSYLKRIDNYIERISQELNERKLAEQELAIKEENYRTLFEQASEGILIVDHYGSIMLFNESMLRLTGYSESEMKGKKITDLFSPEQLKNEPLRYDLLEKGRQVTRIRDLLRKDGKILPIEMRTKRLKDGRYQSFMMDISERLAAEKSLQDFERIFNLSADPICILGKNSKILKANPALAKTLECPMEELLGSPLFDFIHPQDRKWTEEYVAEQISAGNDLIVMDNRYVTKTNKILWLSWIAQIIIKEEISFTIAHDITHLKDIENELVEARDKAEESDRLKTAFLENISHEIRTPMNGIIGFSEMLKDEEISVDERRHYTSIIVNSGHKLMAIVNDILDISSIETGQIDIHREPVNISALMKEVYDFYFPKIQAKGLRFILHQPKGNDIISLSDKVRVNQVLINLVSNALKFTGEGSITLQYAIRDDLIEFSVRDTGVGIEPTMQQVIFERFRQAEVKLSRNHGGAGLGLSISQKLVEMLGGKITLDSSPGKGSTFKFTIPYYPATEEMPLSTKEMREAGSGYGDLNVLVVEDDETNFLYLNELLSRFGFRVKRAMDGKEAINLIKADVQFNLVLMDIRLPNTDGFTATKAIKKLKPDLPVIAQTAYAMTKDRDKAFAAGCDDYLAKPILKKELESILKKFLK